MEDKTFSLMEAILRLISASLLDKAGEQVSNLAVPGSPAAQGPGDRWTVPVQLPVVFCH